MSEAIFVEGLTKTYAGWNFRVFRVCARTRNFPPLSRRKRPQKRDVPPCPGTENRAVYALAVFPAVQ